MYQSLFGMLIQLSDYQPKEKNYFQDIFFTFAKNMILKN